MIYLVTHEDNGWTWNDFLGSFGKALVGRVQGIFPSDLATATSLPVGTYLFLDQELMTSVQRLMLAQVWSQLESDGRSQLLNHPLRVVTRYEFLKLMFQKGINNFRAFHLEEIPSDLRFPVFIRVENDHHGSRSPLIHDWKTLDSWLVRGALGCASNAILIVVEFCDTACSDGNYRKYGSFIVGGKVLMPLVDVKANWVVKMGNQIIPPTADEEWTYLRTNPFEKETAEIAALANFDFGRIDFAFEKGQIRVWEINTNPTLSTQPSKYLPEYLQQALPVKSQLAAALVDLDIPLSPGSVPISLHYPYLELDRPTSAGTQSALVVKSLAEES